MSERTINRRKFLMLGAIVPVALVGGCGESQGQLNQPYPLRDINPDTVKTLERLMGIDAAMPRSSLAVKSALQYTNWGLNSGEVATFQDETTGSTRQIVIDPRDGEQLNIGPRSNLMYPGQSSVTSREMQSGIVKTSIFGPPEVVSRLNKQFPYILPMLLDCFGDRIVTGMQLVVNATPCGNPISLQSLDQELARLYATSESPILNANAGISMVPYKGGSHVTVCLNLNQIERYGINLGITPPRALLSVFCNEVVNYLGFIAVSKGEAKMGNGRSEAFSTLAGLLAGFDHRYATMILGRGGDLYRLALTPIANEMAILRKIGSK